MGLAAFIRSNEDAIVEGWQAFAQTYLPAAAHMDRVALRDHIVGLLRFVADDLETPETERERSEKSKGQGPKGGGADDTAAETHADLRFAGGFDTVEMISEFRALRASVIKLWRAEWSKMDDVLPDLLRFNESIDQIMTESLFRFTDKFNHSGNVLIRTLVQDIRGPLTAVRHTAQVLLAKDKLDVADAKLVSQIESSTARVNLLVSDLIDAVGIQIGQDVSIAPAPMDIGTAVHEAAKKFQAAHPDRKILVDASGDLKGKWDGARVGQILSNLIGNAVQVGSKTSPIGVIAKDAGQEVILSVHSKGAIPPDAVASVFEPLPLRKNAAHRQSATARLDLGLFISKGIVTAHGGKISVTSSKRQGTTVTAHLPRRKNH